jgi:hypothetical protein
MTIRVTPECDHPRVGIGVFKPWKVLRQRVHIDFSLDPHLPRSTGGAVYVVDGDRAWIVLADWLTQREKRCALTHELIHDELRSSCRHAGMPKAWDAVVAREEIWIDREAARRLVPAAELALFLRRQAGTIDPAVTLHDIAEHFDVTERYADLAFAGFAAQLDGWGEIVA